MELVYRFSSFQCHCYRRQYNYHTTQIQSGVGLENKEKEALSASSNKQTEGAFLKMIKENVKKRADVFSNKLKCVH